MLATQIYGTVLGGFINYVMMISIVSGNRESLVNSNGDNSWSGATIQAYNTNATAWALASYLYKSGGRYSIVPIGIAIGAAAVVAHRVFFKVRRFFPTLFQVYRQSETRKLLMHTNATFIIVCSQNRKLRRG